MAEPSKDPVKSRYEAARARRALWDGLLDEAYRYGLPQHPSPMINGPDRNASRGERKGGKVYDNTAAIALDERAALDVNNLFPVATRWLLVDPDIDTSTEGGKKLAEIAETAFETCQRAFDDSNFGTEIYPAIRDARISIGNISLNKGDDRQFGEKWPDVKLPNELATKAETDPESEIELVEGDIYDDKTAQTEYRLWLVADWKELTTFTDQVGRNILFRTDRVPGEIMGRGAIIHALPDIRTADKVVELTLKNASIAVTGIWQADDDGVINVANIKLVPGTIIPKAVGSAGLTPLQTPGNFDVSSLVLSDLQKQIVRTIKGPDLPPVNEGVRTAFEFSLRRADQEAVEWPRMDRIERELFIRLVRRALWILTDPYFAGTDYGIELPTRANAPAPDAQDQNSEDASPQTMDRIEFVDMLMRALETPSDRLKKETDARTAYSGVAAAADLFGIEIVAQKLKSMKFLGDFLSRSGVKAEHMTTEEEDERNEAAAQQQVQQAQQQEQATNVLSAIGNAEDGGSSSVAA